VTFVLVAAPFGVLSADAQPGRGTVVSGSAVISNPSANSTIINQTTAAAIINWQSFSLAPGSSVQFNQPNAAAITLNRVLGGGTSEIYGSLQANGQIWIINSNGILFGRGSQINVAGLLATTSDIADSDFAAGRYNFNTPSSNLSASVDNAGTIHVANGGSAILSGGHVANQGLIQADAGNIVLGGANAFTVDFDGDNLLRYQITVPISNSPTDAAGTALPETVANSGTLAASGGSILMTSRAAANVADNVINNTGIILATSAAVRSGQVILDAGDGTVQAGGTIDASGGGAGQTGGRVALAGNTVRVADGARIDVSGDQGGGTVNIGGDLHGAGPLQNADNTYVGNATIVANAISAGNGGTLVVWSNGLTDFSGIFSATGGLTGGNGGIAETSGHTLNIAPTASVDTLAPNGAVGTWLIDPTTINIVTGGAGPITGSNIDPIIISGALVSSDVTLEATSGTPTSASITVLDDVTYSSSHTLSLLSQGNIVVSANIQNSGAGAVYIIAGWDGLTTDPALAITTGKFGANGGTVYVTSDSDLDYSPIDASESSEPGENEAHDVAIGSASGLTTVAGKYVELLAVYGAAQIGSSGAATGSIVVDATTGVSVSGAHAAQIGNDSGAGNVFITTNNFSATSTPTIKGQTVTLQPYTSSTTMGLGAGTGTLGLSQTVLNHISATTLVFGNTVDSGTMTVGGTVTAPSTITNLHLVTGGNITINASSTLTDANANAQLVLAAGGAFINNDGSGALVAGGTNGRWLVYSSSPTASGVRQSQQRQHGDLERDLCNAPAGQREPDWQSISVRLSADLDDHHDKPDQDLWLRFLRKRRHGLHSDWSAGRRGQCVLGRHHNRRSDRYVCGFGRISERFARQPLRDHRDDRFTCCAEWICNGIPQYRHVDGEPGSIDRHGEPAVDDLRHGAQPWNTGFHVERASKR